VAVRRAFLIARVACIVGGAAVLLTLDLANGPLFHGSRGPMILLSVVVGGLVGNAWWWWKIRQ
jgi:hypothetical protein